MKNTEEHQKLTPIWQKYTNKKHKDNKVLEYASTLIRKVISKESSTMRFWRYSSIAVRMTDTPINMLYNIYLG